MRKEGATRRGDGCAAAGAERQRADVRMHLGRLGECFAASVTADVPLRFSIRLFSRGPRRAGEKTASEGGGEPNVRQGLGRPRSSGAPLSARSRQPRVGRKAAHTTASASKMAFRRVLEGNERAAIRTAALREEDTESMVSERFRPF